MWLQISSQQSFYLSFLVHGTWGSGDTHNWKQHRMSFSFWYFGWSPLLFSKSTKDVSIVNWIEEDFFSKTWRLGYLPWWRVLIVLESDRHALFHCLFSLWWSLEYNISMGLEFWRSNNKETPSQVGEHYEDCAGNLQSELCRGKRYCI